MKQTNKPKDPTENEKQRAVLRELYTCPICGNGKVASRLYGIYCPNPECREKENEMEMQKLAAKLGAGKKRRIR